MSPVAALLWPMLAHMGLTLGLYVWLTLARSAAVKRGEVDYSAFVLGREEPREVTRITRNLANQFELPVFFYTLAVLLILFGRVTTIDIAAAWVFVVGRLIHTLVQTLTEDVRLRGRVFMINTLAVVVLAAHVGMLAFEGIGR